ncbi:hypothetical protein BIY27_24830 [Gibbsiella quercinecans]|nr:hypothetical protein BIY27_24830 [Gibbsiella quercinecans]
MPELCREAKADADGNGLITPAEAKAVEDANKALVDAKQAAQDAVSQVPDEAKEKGGLQDRVDALKTVDVPAITDKDGNGVADFVKANNDSATYIIPMAAVKPKEVFITGSTNEKQSNTDGGISLLFRFGNKPEFAFTVGENSSGKITAKFKGLNVKLGSSYMEIYKLDTSGKEKLVDTIYGKADSWIGGIIGGVTDIIPKYASLDLRDLPPGDYKVKALSGGIAGGLDGTEITFNKVSVQTYESPESVNKNALPLIKGDVLKNDAKDGVKAIKVGAVEGKAIATTKVADFVTVKGKYGDLKMFANGSYEYKANNLNVNDIKKENVDKFTYTVQSPELPGKASTAVLEITIPKFDANAAGPRVKRSLSDDEFTHNPESESHNSNKTAVEGKANDYGKLLVSGHGQINLDNVAGKEKPSDLKSVQADSHVPYSEGAWHSDVKPHNEEHITHDI